MLQFNYKRNVIATLCVALTLFACPRPPSPVSQDPDVKPTETSDAGPVVPTPAATFDDLPELISGPICELLERCFGSAVLEKATEPETCVENMKRGYTQQILPPLRRAIARGTLRFSDVKVRDLIDRIRSASCEEVPSDFFNGLLFEGMVADGSNCELDDECSDISYCQTSNGCPGLCTPRVTVASQATCAEGKQCEVGAYCDDVTETCQPRKQNGEECQSDKACSGLSTCAQTCISQKEFLGQFLVAEGELCRGDGARGALCEKGLACIQKTDSEYRCEKRAVGAQPCGYSRDHLSCERDYFCDAVAINGAVSQGMCVKRGQLGEACNSTSLPEGFLGTCQAGLHCSTSSQICIEPKAAGETCANDSECFSGRCKQGICRSSDAVCQ